MKRHFLYLFLIVAFAACKDKADLAGMSEEEKMEAIHEAKADTQFQRKFFEAEKEKSLGNLDAALTNYYAAAEIKTNANLNYQIARLEANNGKPEVALGLASKAFKEEPTNPWYGELMGELHEYMGDYENAALYFEKAADSESDNNKRYYKAVDLYMQAGQSAKALAILDRLEEGGILTEEIAMQMHRIYLSIGKPEKAVETLEKLIATYPEKESYQLVLIDTLVNTGEGERAKELLMQLAEDSPENGAVQVRLYDLYYLEGKTEQANEALLKALESDELIFAEKMEIVMSYMIAPNPSEADVELGNKLLKTLRENHPTEAHAHALSGDFALQNKDTKKAMEFYNKAVEINPNQSNYWKTLLSLQLENEEYAAMSKNASKALDRYPTDADLYFLKGLGELRKGEANSAVTWLETGKEYVVGDTTLLGRFMSALGEAHHEAKSFAKSDAAFEDALKLQPNDILIKNNYAYFLAERNTKLVKAQQLIDEVIRLDPLNATFLDTQAWVLHKQGKNSEALAAIEQAIAKGASDSGEVMEHKGDILMALDRNSEALTAFLKAKELGDASRKIDQKIASAQQ